MGRFGNGSRNEHDESLLNFIINNELYARNTHFQHKSAHVATYTEQLKT